MDITTKIFLTSAILFFIVMFFAKNVGLPKTKNDTFEMIGGLLFILSLVGMISSVLLKIWL